MKLIIVVIISFVSILFASCEVKLVEAQKLSIKVDETLVIINSDNSENVVIRSKIRTPINLTELEKLKIFSLAEKALKRKSYAIQTKTDFAGQNFKIELVKIKDTFKIENSSVSRWTNIHPEFEEIKNVLSNNNVVIK